MCDHAAREATLLVESALNKLRALEPDEVGVAIALLAPLGAPWHSIPGLIGFDTAALAERCHATYLAHHTLTPRGAS